MITCIRQTEFVVNTFLTAPISTIDTFVSYVVIEKKYYLICFPRELSQTSDGTWQCNSSHKNVNFSPYSNISLKAGIESCYSPPSYSC